jgi:outer membrane protein assembly factor BamB
MKGGSLLVLCWCFVPTIAVAENWPAWRGPTGTGQSSETGFPVSWSAEQNVAWKKPLPGPGNSTPIVWGDRVLLSCAQEKGAVRSLLCFRRTDGELIWQRDVPYQADPAEPTHDTNPYCSSSPTTDGQRVVVWHGSAGVFAYDLDGKLLWQKDLGKFEHIWGNASSPLICDDLVILSCGPGLRAFVVALKLADGQEVWRIEPPQAQSTKIDEYRGSWSTPVLYQDGARQLVLLSLPQRLYAIDPKTGNEIWSSGGLGDLVYTSPLTSSDTVVAMSGYGGPALAVRSGGSGDVTETHAVWSHKEKNPQRVGSGIIVGQNIFILNENGVAWCLDLATGERRWEQRLGDANCWSSMCHVDGRIYVINMEGETIVLEPDPAECRVVAQNPLGELTRGSLAFSQGQIFVRTYQHLYCIGQANTP